MISDVLVVVMYKEIKKERKKMTMVKCWADNDFIERICLK